MNSNFFKSYFKANGIVSTLVLTVTFFLLGVVSITTGNKSIINFIDGDTALALSMFTVVVGVLSVGSLFGLSGLKSTTANFVDVLRTSGLISGVALSAICLPKAIGAVTAPGLSDKFLVAMIFILAAATVTFCAELIVRIVSVKEDAEKCGVKNYFGSFAKKYNPLVILCVGTVLAAIQIAVTIAVPSGVINFYKWVAQYGYLVSAILLVETILLVAAVADRTSTASVIDLVFGIVFVAFAELFIVSSFKGFLGGSDTRAITNVFMIVCLFNFAAIFIRAVTYSNDEDYTNTSQKVRTYFNNAYKTYNMILPTVVACASIVVLTVIGGIASGNTDVLSSGYLIALIPAANNTLVATILSYLYVGLTAVLVIISLIYNKFTKASTVRQDKVLPMLFFVTVMGMIAGLFGFVVPATKVEDLAVEFIVLTAVSAVFFIYALIIQIIRLKSFDPAQEMIAQSIIEAQRAKEQQETAAEEEPAEEEVVEEAEESNDPFALTEEDEEIYNAIYGVKEEPKQEEVEEAPAEEEVVEEVVEEEIVEEVVEEEVAEAPAEEPVAEETVAPVEEEAAEEEAEDEEDEDEAEDEEETEEEESAEDEASAEVKNEKERSIVLQQFEVLDENGQPKKIKRKFNAKMMYADPDTKDYYNEIKNYLEMYRAKGRQSSRCETFRYKGLVAKVALGGKAVKVFLAIDPSYIEENPKYHLKDVSEKKQYKDVPVLIKVRSDRGLKYFKELVDYMMANRGVKPKRNFEPTNYIPSLIPNGEAILGAMGMPSDYMHDTMNVRGIPADLPDNLEEFIPQYMGEPLEEEEEEATVYLDTLCIHFNDGDEVTIDTLKSMHIVHAGNVIRIKARGTIDRKLIVYAEYFDEDALKMMLCTNCTAIKIVR